MQGHLGMHSSALQINSAFAELFGPNSGGAKFGPTHFFGGGEKNPQTEQWEWEPLHYCNTSWKANKDPL